MNYTKKDENGNYYSDFMGPKNGEIQKLGQLEDFGRRLGADILEFLSECDYVLTDCGEAHSTTSDGDEIVCDFCSVLEFITLIKNAVLKKHEKDQKTQNAKETPMKQKTFLISLDEYRAMPEKRRKELWKQISDLDGCVVVRDCSACKCSCEPIDHLLTKEGVLKEPV